MENNLCLYDSIDSQEAKDEFEIQNNLRRAQNLPGADAFADGGASVSATGGGRGVDDKGGGRKGKGVTTISGIPLPHGELKTLAKTLKQRCGTGGAVKEGVVEIQGDHRETLRDALTSMGYQVKLAGG